VKSKPLIRTVCAAAPISLLAQFILSAACVPAPPLSNPPLSGDEDAIRQAAEQLDAARRASLPAMYRGTSFHTGQVRIGESLPISLRQRWRREDINIGVHTASKSSPVADGDALFVGADSGVLYAIDARDGATLWEWPSHPSTNGIHATPAVDDSRVYIGDYAGWLTALDRFTGAVLWETKLGGSIGSSPVIVGDEIYVGVETPRPDGFLAVVDRESGARLRESQRFGDHTHCTPTIDPLLGRAYIGSNHGNMLCLDALNMQELWRFSSENAPDTLPFGTPAGEFHGQIKSTAALVEQRVVFTSWDNNLYCLDAGDGSMLWSFASGSRSMSSPAVDPERRRIYFGSHDTHVYSVDFDTGGELWRYRTGARVYSSPVVVPRTDGQGNVIVVGSYDAGVYLLDEEDGAALWQARMSGPVTSVPLVHGGRLFVSSDGGDLVCWE
jgi:outer membrane protein assembly factor BamB